MVRRTLNANKKRLMKADLITLQSKVEELIVKHNELARVVMDLSQAIELINDAVFSQGEPPQKLDS